MPKGTLVRDSERKEIVKQKLTTKKDVREIAKSVGRSPATVSLTKYEDLKPSDQAEVDAYVRDYEERIARLRHKATVKAEAIIDNTPDDDVKSLPAVVGAFKIADDILRKTQGHATEIVEHRSALDSAKAALLRAMATGMFKESKRPDVIDAVAKQYGVDPKLLTE